MDITNNLLKKIKDGRRKKNNDSVSPPKKLAARSTYWEKTVEWVFVQKYFRPKMIAAPLDDVAEGLGDVLINFSLIKKWSIIEFKSDDKKFVDEREKYPIFGYSKWAEREAKGASYVDANEAFLVLVEYWKTEEKPPHHFVYGEIDNNKWISEVSNTISKLRKDSITRKIGDELAVSFAKLGNQFSLDVRGISYWGDWCNSVKHKISSVPASEVIILDELDRYGWDLDRIKKYVGVLLRAKALVDGGGGGGGGAIVDWLFSTVMGVLEDGTGISFSLYEFAVQLGLIPPPPSNTPPQNMVNPVYRLNNRQI